MWHSLVEFAKAHPEMFWALVTAFLTALFKPRSEEEYAKLPPRVGAALKLMSAFGIDPVKAVEAIKQLVAGKSEAPTQVKAFAAADPSEIAEKTIEQLKTVSEQPKDVEQ